MRRARAAGIPHRKKKAQSIAVLCFFGDKINSNLDAENSLIESLIEHLHVLEAAGGRTQKVNKQKEMEIEIEIEIEIDAQRTLCRVFQRFSRCSSLTAHS